MFPLPENYFPPMELSAQEVRKYNKWAQALLDRTIDAYHRDQFLTREQRESNWKVIKQRGGLTAYRHRKGSEDENSEHRYLCSGHIEGSLDEVMLGRYADNTDTYRRMSAVYREDLVDCAVVHVIEKQSPAKPHFFSGFKWMTVKSPGKGLVKNRDVCWFEQMGLTKDRNGKEIGYAVADSVDLASCPPFDSSHCVRAHLSNCYLFKPDRNGGTKMYMLGNNSVGGKVVDWLADLKSADLWLRAERVINCAHAYVGSQMIKTTRPLISTQTMNMSNRCEVCQDKASSVVASAKECSVCRRITCSRCVIKRRILSSHKDFLHVERESFCKRCVRCFHEIDHRNPASLSQVCTAAVNRRSPSTATSTSYDSADSHVRSPEVTTVTTQHKPSRRDPRARAPRPKPTKTDVVSSEEAITATVGTTASSCPATPIILYSDSSPDVRQGSKSMGRSPAPTSFTARRIRMVSTDSQSSQASEVSYTDSSDGGVEAPVTGYRRPSANDSVGKELSSQQHNSLPSSVSVSPIAESESDHDPAAGSPPSPPPPVYDTPESMMEKMIRMNIMAEQARQMVKENDKFARQYSANYA